MFSGEEFVTVKGITLSREYSSTDERKLWVKLFLKGQGIVALSSKNFMGDSEPFMWAVYNLRKKLRSKNYYVEDIDVQDDMFHIRRSRETLITILDWTNLLLQFLPFEQPADDLLNNLYWNMKLLAAPSLPYYLSDWRFVWKWLELWGLAPEIVDFLTSNNFNNDEIILLAKITRLNLKDIINLLSQPISENIRENSFKIAAKLARRFLIQT